jgi:hypothetical protein
VQRPAFFAAREDRQARNGLITGKLNKRLLTTIYCFFIPSIRKVRKVRKRGEFGQKRGSRPSIDQIEIPIDTGLVYPAMKGYGLVLSFSLLRAASAGYGMTRRARETAVSRRRPTDHDIPMEIRIVLIIQAIWDT